MMYLAELARDQAIELAHLRGLLAEAQAQIRVLEREWAERDLNDYACARAMSDRVESDRE